MLRQEMPVVASQALLEGCVRAGVAGTVRSLQAAVASAAEGGEILAHERQGRGFL